VGYGIDGGEYHDRTFLVFLILILLLLGLPWGHPCDKK